MKKRRFPAVGRPFGAHHGLTQNMVDIKRLPMQLVAGLELPIHLVREVMESGVKIIFVADHDNKISRRVSGVSHRIMIKR